MRSAKGGQPLTPRKVPERRCTGCGEHFPKSSLIRIVRCPDGEIKLDFVGKVSGRGAYLCRSLSCFRQARRTRRIEQNLSCSIPDALYDALENELSGHDK
jgi:predicted RNA-binding protein YlxR (DUF448 family)